MPGLTTGQRDVFEALSQFGPLPDHALVPLAQHVLQTPQSSSSIRSRRAELVRKRLVTGHGKVVIPRTGRRAQVWGVIGE